MEYVDIIDESGKRIRSVSKKEAHEKGLFHKCVVAEVIDSHGRWLLTKQASDRQDAGQFVSPVGGHISAGETEENALLREAGEELGIADFTFKHIGEVLFNREIIGRKENHMFILYEIYSDKTPVLNHESQDYQWFTKEELRKELQENKQKFGNAFFVVLKNFYSDLL